MFRNNPGGVKAQACHDLEFAETPMFQSTEKTVLHRYGLRRATVTKSMYGGVTVRLSDLRILYKLKHGGGSIMLKDGYIA